MKIYAKKKPWAYHVPVNIVYWQSRESSQVLFILAAAGRCYTMPRSCHSWTASFDVWFASTTQYDVRRSQDSVLALLNVSSTQTAPRQPRRCGWLYTSCPRNAFSAIRIYSVLCNLVKKKLKDSREERIFVEISRIKCKGNHDAWSRRLEQ